MSEPSFTPEEAIVTADLITDILAVFGVMEEEQTIGMAAWIANLMLIMDEAADSGCPCTGCTKISEMKQSSLGEGI